jgi:translation initiation factor IF-2
MWYSCGCEALFTHLDCIPSFLVNGNMLKQGLPSQPVRIVGFKSLPKAGDPILCVESEEIAEEMVEQLVTSNEEEIVDRPRNTDEVEIHINGVRARDTRRVARFHQLAGLVDDDGTIRIPIIVKANADGSLSAVRDSLVSLGVNCSHKVIVDPIQEGIGEITATDIQMAKESNACIFAFGLKRTDQAVLNLAESEGVVIRSNDIIYSLLDDAKETLGRYLPAQPSEKVHGRASIQAIFVVDGDSGEEKVAGLKILDGNLYRDKNAENIRCNFRVYRNGTQVSPEGEAVKAHSLRRFKELVESVRHGDECGLVMLGYDEFQEGDEIECYSVEMKTSTLE